MAEEDWYGPFNWLTRDHLHAVVLGIAGVVITVAGVLGYDLGGRFTAGKGWTGHVQWFEIGVGLVVLASAVLAGRSAINRPRGLGRPTCPAQRQIHRDRHQHPGDDPGRRINRALG